jgi:hypothetical protein
MLISCFSNPQKVIHFVKGVLNSGRVIKNVARNLLVQCILLREGHLRV